MGTVVDNAVVMYNQHCQDIGKSDKQLSLALLDVHNIKVVEVDNVTVRCISTSECSMSQNNYLNPLLTR